MRSRSSPSADSSRRSGSTCCCRRLRRSRIGARSSSCSLPATAACARRSRPSASGSGWASASRLLGHVADPSDVYQAADLFVQSADYEGTPNAVLEAMAFEVPIVATDAGGTRELIRHARGRPDRAAGRSSSAACGDRLGDHRPGGGAGYRAESARARSRNGSGVRDPNAARRGDLRGARRRTRSAPLADAPTARDFVEQIQHRLQARGP